MAINPIPVTFHLTADARPELVDAQRRRARPYRVIVQGVVMFMVMGLGFGYIMSSMVDVHKAAVASAPPTAAPAQAVAAVAAPAPQPLFPVWQPPARNPVRQAAIPEPTPETAPASDRTPVATILESASAPLPRGFAPLERAPQYSGFKVTAGH